jgi:hypothetical protein
MLLMRRAPGFLMFCAVAAAACAGSENKSGTAGTTGSAGSTSAAGTTGTAGSSGAAGATTAGSTGSAGSAGSTGSAGTTGGGGAGSTGSGGGGSTGTAGSTAAPDGGAKDAPAGEVAGPTTTAGCAGKNYQLCLDFEDGIDTNVWSGGTASAVVTTHPAHGTHSYHLYDGATKTTAGRLMSKTVGTIKDQVYARFYIHFSPGAPGGHGNIVAAYDKSGSWYEMGYQFDGMMGVWHGGGGEHPRRSKPYIVDQWYCIEAFFDGKNAAMPKWWIDGADAIIYEPVWANGNTTKEGGPTPTVSTQFTRMEAGLSAYAGLGLKQPDTVGDQTDTRVLMDLWIDDIAFDTQRIGCIQ